MRKIQPFASKVPYMTSPGNHGEFKIIEDIYFFEVNTKHISSSVFKTSEFSQVCSTSENSDVFNSRDEIYLVHLYLPKTVNFLFISILFIGYMQ